MRQRAKIFLRAEPGCLMAALLLLLLMWRGVAAPFYVDYSEEPPAAALQVYPLSILSPDAKVELAPAQKLGNKIYSYVSVVEIARDATYREQARAKGIKVIGTNDVWQSALVDVTQPAWADFVVEQLARPAAAKGFDGFFLDTVDSVELLAKLQPQRAAAHREGLVKLIQKLKQTFPDKQIILNRGFEVWQSVSKDISGVLIESVFQTVDVPTKTYAAVKAEDTQWLVNQANQIKQAGLAVYVLDYVDPQQLALADATAKRIADAGFHALIATPELHGEVLAPLRAEARHVLVLYGSDERSNSEAIHRPDDSAAGQMFQMPLEWLGCEVEYLDLTSDPLPPVLPAKYRGVITDDFLDIPTEREAEVAEWLIKVKARGQKVIFMGGLPFEEPSVLENLLRGLGVKGTGSIIKQVQNVQIAHADKVTGYEAKLNPMANGFLDLQAPDGAKVHLSLTATDEQKRTRTFQPLFAADWGGMALDPYVLFQRADFVYFWYIDPFAFLSEALALPNWPAPDTSTRDGKRIFFTHIDGDGFRHKSSVEIGKTSSDILMERVVKKYPVPFTCSIIEAEIRGIVVGQEAGDSERLVKLAREMFAMPKVEAASHSYSHPFFWDENDKTAATYEEQALEIKGTHQVKGIDLHKEIVGSVKYIENELLPPGKKVEIFLWSGNCRPPAEALRLTRELGIENMNGGDTIISRKYPTISRVAPRTVLIDGELHIYTAVQNENVYRGEWQQNGQFDLPFYGGFIHVIDTFKMTETPRRLKPVNIYFHWYSGDNHEALRGLTRPFEWAMTQPLHSLTAGQYARIARDARATTIYRQSDREWTLVNRGYLRTFRLDPQGLVPDMAASQGITGYVVSTNALYIHTDGSTRVNVSLTDKPAAHLRLVSSSAEIQFAKLEAKAAQFTVQDVRACEVLLGGLPADQAVQVSVNGESSTKQANAAGELALTLPETAKVEVKF